MDPEQIGTDLLLVVAAALVDGQGRVLVQCRPPGSSLPGLWEFPGGKPEAGESPEQALSRELAEELGISTEPGDFIPTVFASEPLSDRHLLLMLFICRNWEGEPQPLHATELRWIHPADLHTLAMPPADYPLITGLVKLL